MTDPLFFKRPQGLNAGEIAAITGATPLSSSGLDRRICNIATLDRAGPSDLTFLDSAKLAGKLASTCAGICLSSDRFAHRVPAHVVVLVAREPYRAFVTTARALFPDALRPSSLFAADGAASGASVHPTARIESAVTIDAGAVIGPRAEIGSGTVVGANAVIGADVRVGRDCAIGAGATVLHALIGDRVIIHPGARIGQDGFGYVPGKREHLKVPQVGRVIVQDDVEIGANTTIDRGAARDTTIGEGTKIDNLVQIGHNATIGRHCLIAGQTGLSGSVTLGDYVMLGGKVGFADHLTVGEGAQIGAGSGVMHDVPAGEQWAGSPASPLGEALRQVAMVRRLGRIGPAGLRGTGMDPHRGDESK